MISPLLRLRLAKLGTSLTHPICWRALCNGVAPSTEHLRALRPLAVDGIIDVGGNRGQFTLFSRLVWPKLPVLAFEPIPHEAAIFRKVHGGCSEVTLIESALGAVTGRAQLHLSQSFDSSSLLPIGSYQSQLFKNTAELGTLDVPIHRLDEFSEFWERSSRQLLKIDVQGFELQVLRGALATLKMCSFVYVECSEISLYEGQALRAEVENFLRGHNFRVTSRHNEEWHDRKLVQADYLFVRH